MEDDIEYLTRTEAADKLGVAVRTVDRYADKGLITRYMRLSRVYFRADEIDDMGGTRPVVK